MSSKLLAAAILLAAAAIWTPVVHAAGLGRPTPFSARAFGMGGAMVATANDPSALHYNPAALTLQLRDSFMFGVGTVYADRSYTPQLAGQPEGETQNIKFAPAVLPVLGYATRLESRGIPSRLALGVGVWNTYGGSAEWPLMDPNTRALNTTVSVVLEIVPGLAYEVNDWLSLGFAFRIGIGILEIDSTKNPSDAQFSGTGIGAGASAGLLLRPTDSLRIGLTYRTSMTAHIKGDGIALVSPPEETALEVRSDQKWPQSAAGGIAYQVSDSLLLATQVDWIDWSRIQDLVFELDPVLERVEPTDFDDSLSLHVGGEFAATDAIDARAGYTFETGVIPDRTMARQYLTGPSHAIGLGGGFDLSKAWHLDVGAELILPAERTVEDNSALYGDGNWPGRRNAQPGTFTSTVYTLEVNAHWYF